MLPFRITDGYESKYADQVIQESEEVPFPFFKGANKTEASATTNCFGGWQTYPNFVKRLLKNDPDHAKERLNAFLQARGTSYLIMMGVPVTAVLSRTSRFILFICKCQISSE
jgi:hypothetical protein